VTVLLADIGDVRAGGFEDPQPEQPERIGTEAGVVVRLHAAVGGSTRFAWCGTGSRSVPSVCCAALAGFGLWALEVLATGDFIGFTGLNPMPDGVPGAGDQEVGWRLARHAWHRGYATEAARAALDVGLHRLALPVIWSMTAVLNAPSQAVMQRLGMVRHGTFDHPRIEMGHALRPHVVYRTWQPPASF
jgi:hypothetical protein